MADLLNPPSWYDYAEQLPADIPDVAYDAQRQKYFDQVVKPWAYKNRKNPEAVRAEFMEKTGRKDKSSFPRIELGAASAAKALIEPIANITGQKEVQELLRSKEESAVVEATRQGISPAPYQMIGSLAGQLPYWYAGMELAGLAAKAVVNVGAATDLAAATARLATTRKLFNTAAGAAIQGGYNAAVAEEGHRSVEGALGAIEGGLGVGVFEAAGPLWKALRAKHGISEEAAKAVEATAKGVADEVQTAAAAEVVEKVPEVVADVAKTAGEAVKAGRKRGRPRKNPVAEPTAKDVAVEVAMPGAPAPVAVKITQENIEQAGPILSEALAKGGSIDSITGDVADVQRILAKVDDGAVSAGLYDVVAELRAEPGAVAEKVVVPMKAAEEVAAPLTPTGEAAAEALPANPLISQLKSILLDPKLTADQKRVSRLRLQRLSPESLQEIDAMGAMPTAEVPRVGSPPTEAPAVVDEGDVSAQLARMREVSRKKAEAEGVLQPQGNRIGLEDISEFDHLEQLKSGKVRDKITGRVYANADQALRAKGLSAPEKFAVGDKPPSPPLGEDIERPRYIRQVREAFTDAPGMQGFTSGGFPKNFVELRKDKLSKSLLYHEGTHADLMTNEAANAFSGDAIGLAVSVQPGPLSKAIEAVADIFGADEVLVRLLTAKRFHDLSELTYGLEPALVKRLEAAWDPREVNRFIKNTIEGFRQIAEGEGGFKGANASTIERRLSFLESSIERAPEKFAMPQGESANLARDTQIVERPLQTRVTGQLANESLPPNAAAGTNAPYGQKPIIYYRNPNKTNMFHEGVHGDIGNLGLTGLVDHVVRNHPVGKMMEGAFDNITSKLYGQTWPEEAYVYAASYVRTGATDKLQKFIDADTDRASVFKWIADTSDELLKGIAERPDASLHKRVAERKIREVLRRTTGELDTIARDSVAVVGDSLEMKGGKYVVTTRTGASHVFDDRDSLVEFLESNYEQPLSAPSLVDESLLPDGLPRPAVGGDSHSLGKAPLGGEPPFEGLKFATAQPGEGPKGGKITGGVQAFSFYTRPFLAWMDTVAKKNEWPELYHVFKKIDDAKVGMENFLGKYREDYKAVFEGVSAKRRSDFSRYLEAATEDKEKVAAALHITDAEIGRLNIVRQNFFDKLATEFGIRADTFLENYLPRIREANFDPDLVRPHGNLTQGDIDFFAKHIRTGELDPRKTDLLDIMDTYLRLGAKEKFLKEPIKAAADLIDLKSPDGSFVTGTLRPMLQRKIEQYKNIPDFTGQMMDSAANAVKESVNGFIESYNSKVSPQLRIEQIEATPHDIMGKWILFQYAGGLGLRPMVPFRDFLQTWITSYPILGGKYLSIGAKRAFEKGAFAEAREAGALMWDNPMHSLYREDSSRMASGMMTKAAEGMLAPLRYSNNVSRLISFWGHYERAMDAFTTFKTTGNVKQLMRESAMTWLDETMQKEYVRLLQAGPAGSALESIGKRVAKDLTEVAHWNYKQGANPGIYSYTLGRLLGQYGTWPLNYIEFIRRLIRNPDKVEVSKAFTRIAAAHGAILAAGDAAGVDTAQWVFTQPLAYGGGPLFQAVVNVPGTADFESFRGREARKAVVRPIYPGSIPGGMAIERLHDALATDDPELWKILLGFVPLKEGETDKGWHQLVP